MNSPDFPRVKNQLKEAYMIIIPKSAQTARKETRLQKKIKKIVSQTT